MKTNIKRYIRLIVISVSLLAAVVFGNPLVEEYASNRDSLAEFEGLRREHSRYQQQREMLVATLNPKKAILTELTQRATTEDCESDLRDRIIRLVRDSGCQLRQIEIGLENQRSWGGISDDPAHELLPVDLAPGPFDLQSFRLNLTVAGPQSVVLKFVHNLAKLQLLSEPEQILLHPTDGTGSHLQLELRLKLFGLVKREIEQEEPLGLESLVQTP